MEWPDAYSHATDASSKEVLSGEQLDEALQFLMDSSHFIGTSTVPRRTMATSPSTRRRALIPVALPLGEWTRLSRPVLRSGLTRSVNWLSTNPNGGINSSVGSYWACIAPNTDLTIENNEVQGYEKSDKWQMIASCLRDRRWITTSATAAVRFYIDASLASNYGIDPAWEYRNILMVEVELDHYVPRACTPQEYYDGEPPTTSSWLLAGRMAALENWKDKFLSIPQYWGCATGDAAAKNLTTDEERAAYIETLNADPDVIEAMTGVCYYMHFNILQIVNNKQELGFDFEQASGKGSTRLTWIDGLLDRYPEGSDKAGQLILQNADAAMPRIGRMR